MTVEIALFNGSGLLPLALEAEIRAGIEDGIAALRRYVALERIGIAVHLFEGVGKNGVGGFAYGPDSCAIYVDEGCPALSHETRTNVASITVHELHHVLRFRHGGKRRFSALCAGEIIALEGLATQCEVFLGYPEPLTVCDVSDDLTQSLLELVAPIVSDPTANWRWIYGLNLYPERVYRAVYPMGHKIVGTYLARSGRSPIEALGTPWEEIWRGAVDESA